jgi:membrane protease YdiL (CAAX protease family)
LAAYWLLAYGITWLLAIPAGQLVGFNILPVQFPAAVVMLCAVVLHYGPTLAALVLATTTEGRHGLRELLGRLGRWRVGIGWYLFVFLFMPLVHLAAVGINVLLGGAVPQFFSAKELPQGANPLLLFPVVLLATILQAGLAEEVGWRGYALPRLQARWGALVSSLVLSVIWWAWHFHPLNWQLLQPIAGWYLFLIVPLTILFTWLWNNTRGSLLIVVLFHAMNNASDWIVPVQPGLSSGGSFRLFILTGCMIWVVALAVVAIYGPSSLQRIPSQHPLRPVSLQEAR